MFVKSSFLFTGFLLFFFSSTLCGQELLGVDTSRRCIYSNSISREELRKFNSDNRVSKMIEDIRRVAELPSDIRFEAINVFPVHSVAAIAHANGFYLLYNRQFFYDHRSDTAMLYALLAHEIGHLVLGHQLNGVFRIFEETAADEFAGQILVRLLLRKQFKLDNPDTILPFVKEIPFTYKQVDWGDRETSFRNGWICESILMPSPVLGFSYNPDELDKYPIPRFRLTSSCEFNTFPFSTQFNGCKYLENVDDTLRMALDKCGYKRFAYFAVENGFALSTCLEQYLDGGENAPENIRWQDSPKRPEFQGTVDYVLKTLGELFFPRSMQLRIFVFIVTDKPDIQCEKDCLNTDQVREWLRKHGDWLPPSIGNKPFTADYRVMALVFQYNLPESTLQFSEVCANRLPAFNHLERSGILKCLSH